MEFQDDRVRLRQSSISSLDSASGALITIGEYREKDGWTSSGLHPTGFGLNPPSAAYMYR
jgi:hypothetical protein